MKITLLMTLFILSMSLAAKEKIDIELYGIVKASILHSNQAINSFSNINLSAPTSASEYEKSSVDREDRTSFQVVQSRFGINSKINTKVSSIMEFDFINFSQSSPTTTSRPRLRRALISYKLNDNYTIQVGQDWDIFSAFSPMSFNYIGNYNNSGNIGFMRQQAKLLSTRDILSWGIAVGQAANNDNSLESDLETNNEISQSAFIRKDIGNIKAGFSLIHAKRKINEKNKSLWGLSSGIIFDNAKLKLVAEVYHGEGLNRLGVLSLPSNEVTHETGGYISSKFKLEHKKSLYLGAGIARHEEGEDITNFDAATGRYSNLGINNNQTYKLGFSKKIDDIELFIEESYFVSDYSDDQMHALASEIGMMVRF